MRGTNQPPAHLKLRLIPRRKQRKAVSWTDGVVDNEGLGRKSSKCCCIYHRPKAFDESSSDESSSDEDNGESMKKGKRRVRKRDTRIPRCQFEDFDDVERVDITEGNEGDG